MFLSIPTASEKQAGVIDEINLVREDVDTAMSLARIRQTIDTRDAFYDAESSFFDENSPRYQALIDEYYRALTTSRFRPELEKRFGKRLFALAEAAQKTFKPEIMEDLSEENRLCTEYMKLLASAEIDFDGKKLNLSGLGPYRESSDRETRRSASEAYFGFLGQNREKLDSIYDSLVHVRHRMAIKLGFKNFIPLAYLRMSRLDYDANMVRNYRESILKTIVPVANGLREDQRIRLNLEHLYYYDLPFRFKSGNPKPQGSAKDIIREGREMYHALSKETGEFIDRMLDEGLMDLETRPGKAGGGYCSWIPKYKAPFIFSNFNGTSGDVDVLTHEAGHAFQAHMSKDFEIPEYVWPTMEAAEIHSMSMEFITWPWMDRFFGPEADKYRFMHLSDAFYSSLTAPWWTNSSTLFMKIPDSRRRNALGHGANWKENTCHTGIFPETPILKKADSGNVSGISMNRPFIISITPWPRSAPSSIGRNFRKTGNRHGRIISGSARQAEAPLSWNW